MAKTPIGGYGSGTGKDAYGNTKYVNPGYTYKPYQFPQQPWDAGLGQVNRRNMQVFNAGGLVPVQITGYQPPTGTGGSFQYRGYTPPQTATGTGGAGQYKKTTAKKPSTRTTPRRSAPAPVSADSMDSGSSMPGADPMVPSAPFVSPTQVATDFGSFVSSLNTAPLYRGGVNYAETLGRYVRPADYQSAPGYQSSDQYRSDWLKMTENVAADPSQRSATGPLGLTPYNLVPTLASVRGIGPEGTETNTYRSSADAARISALYATDAQLASPEYRATLESIAREGGLLGPSAEEQALLRQRIDAQLAAAQQRGQQATAQWNQWNPGMADANFVPFIGTDQYGNNVLANDPNAMLKIRQALVQSLGGGFDPYANVNDQGALLGY